MARKKRRISQYLKRHRKHADTPYVAGGATIGIFVMISVLLFGASWLQFIALSKNNFAAVISAVLVDLVNTDRNSNGVSNLSVNSLLVEAAQAKANDMAARGYFSHNGPDGKEPWGWIQEAGYNYQFAGENLAIQFSDSIEVERAWLASPTHRANLLDSRFTEVGIATAYGTYQSKPTTFVVQMFALPAVPARAGQIGLSATTDIPKTETTNLQVKPADVEETVIVLGTVAQAPPSAEPPAPQAPWWAHIIASPQTYLHWAFIALAALVLLVGTYVWWFEVRQKHYHHGAYAIVLSVVLLIALYVADMFIFTDPIISSLT